MVLFPLNSAAFFVAIYILESVAGILKSNSLNKGVFWIGRMIELICAAILSAALILAVARESYSRLEVGAAYSTVALHGLLLIADALIVARIMGDFRKLPHIVRVRRLEEDGWKATMYSVITAEVLGVSGLPILYANVQQKSP